MVARSSRNSTVYANVVPSSVSVQTSPWAGSPPRLAVTVPPWIATVAVPSVAGVTRKSA